MQKQYVLGRITWNKKARLIPVSVDQIKKERGVAPYPPLLLPTVPLAASFNIDPNVFPLSVLILRTGTLLVANFKN
jgi:hypothetical protein